MGAADPLATASPLSGDGPRLAVAGAYPTSGGAGYAVVVENPGSAPAGVRGDVTISGASGGRSTRAGFVIPYIAPRGRAAWADTIAAPAADPPLHIQVELHAVPPGDPGSAAIVVTVSGTPDGAQPVATLLLTNHNAVPVEAARLSVVAFDARGAVVGGGFRTAPALPPHLDTQLVVPLQTVAPPARAEGSLAFTAATHYGAGQ